MEALKLAVRWISESPSVLRLREARYRRAFEDSRDGWPRFYGLFATREEALAAAPLTRLIGYDHPEVGDVNVELMGTVWPSDYPVIYWLYQLVQKNGGVFDLGGHTGTKYRAWRPLLPLPDHFTWTVCDLPSLLAAGRRMAGGAAGLRFTSRHQRADGSDILLASGVLQYMDRELQSILGECKDPPRHLLLNKVPTHDATDVYTLENLNRSTVPYRIFQRSRLVDALGELGYRQVDAWTVPECWVKVPFRALENPVHRGFYFRRDADS